MIARVDETGRELGWVRVDNHPVTLVQAVREAGRGAPVAIEATYAWYWAVDVLLAAGCDVHLAHPYGMRALRKRKRVKSDPADAYELANLLRLGSLPESSIAPPELRELRELVRHRRQLVKLSTASAAVRLRYRPCDTGHKTGRLTARAEQSARGREPCREPGSSTCSAS